MHTIEKEIRTGALLCIIVGSFALLIGIYYMGDNAVDVEYLPIAGVINVLAGALMLKYKSRVASTYIFTDHAFGALILAMAGDPPLFILKSILSYFLFVAMVGTYKYHKITEIEATVVDNKEV